MSNPEPSGYDAAQNTRESDDLGRWRFASEIADVIRSTPPEWSARIGIFGKWGEGKSTILHFLEEMLKPEGNIAFYFNPWAIQDLDELWAEFGKRLVEALVTLDLVAESALRAAARKVQTEQASAELSEMGDGLADLFGRGRIHKNVLGIVGEWLRPDGEQVAKIRRLLGNQRVIVFIDDLDRANPELLPKLLLSLRELLDLPGFTFVLAFDNEIVSTGLANTNKAWRDGANFLDKILDFHYFLPPVSKSGKRLLLKNMLDRYCRFVPESSIDPIESLLPSNPRKLKMLVRGLIALQPQLARHGDDEINWVEIWLAEMVRQESHTLFVRLLEGDTLDRLVGAGYKLRNAESKNSRGDEPANENADLARLIDDVGGISKQNAERLIELLNATRTLAGIHLAYNFRFALRPEALTWKEFYALLALWKENQAPETISAWIAAHSLAQSIDRADIERDLFETLLNARHNIASEAAEALTIKENKALCDEAETLLKMTGQFLSLPETITAERFGKLYEKSVYWIAFRPNPADAALRAAEQELIYTVLKNPSGQAPGMLEALKPWGDWALPSDDAESARMKKQIRDKCVTLLLPSVEEDFADYLARPESIRLLCSPAGRESFRYVLFNPSRIPWAKTIRKALLKAFRNAKNDLNDYEKANDLLQALVDAYQGRSPCVTSHAAELIVADQEMTAALWRGAVSRSIQTRMLKVYLNKRKILMRLGAREEDLPLTNALAKADELEQVSRDTYAS